MGIRFTPYTHIPKPKNKDKADITIRRLTHHPSFIHAELIIDGVNYDVGYAWLINDQGKKIFFASTCTIDQPIYEKTNQEALDQFAEYLTNQGGCDDT